MGWLLLVSVAYPQRDGTTGSIGQTFEGTVGAHDWFLMLRIGNESLCVSDWVASGPAWQFGWLVRLHLGIKET
jgi:hypothetical protein